MVHRCNFGKGIMLPFTLQIHIISRFTHNYYAEQMKKIGLTMGQFSFVTYLCGHPGVSQERLSEALHITKSATAKIIQQMEENDLARREQDTEDRRANKVFPTDKAMNLIPEIEPIVDRCHKEITKDLTPIEYDLLNALLEKVKDRVMESYSKKADLS